MNTRTQKIALITGESRALGRNTAERLARKGVETVITYRGDEASLVVRRSKHKGRKAVALQLDTGATQTFDRYLRACGVINAMPPS